MNRNSFGPSVALLLAACALTSAGPVLAANLLVNPGFEDAGGSYAGWTTFGNGVQLSAASGDFIVHSGLEASKIFGEFTGCPIPSFDVGGYFQSFAPAVGLDYVFSGWSFVSSADPIPGTTTCGGNRCVAKIAFFNAASGGSEISSNEVVIGDANSPLDQWVPFTVSAPAPTGALRVEVLVLYLQPGCDPGAVFVDDLSFEGQAAPAPGLNLLANPSFDASLAGWTVFGNAFYEGRGNTLPQFAFARRTPPGAAKMYSTFVVGSDSGMYQSFAAAPGSEWRFQVYSLTSCGEDPIDGTSDSYANAKIAFLDGGGTEIGSAEDIIVDATSRQGTWTKHTVVARAPAGTATVRPYLLFISPSLLPMDACFVDDALFRSETITDVSLIESGPDLTLGQNFPNPFRENTRIEFRLPATTSVRIDVFDVAGRKVVTLEDGIREAGWNSVDWDGRLADGTRAAAGIYQYRVTTPESRIARRMVLLK
ncbi:MAG: FlgD immunoglobulin-like domain containing protein [bacterium]